MNVRRNRKTEGPKTDGQRSMHRCCGGGMTQPKVLVPDMSQERGAAGKPGRKSPGDAHPIGRDPRQGAECQADDEVQHPEEYHRPAPASLT